MANVQKYLNLITSEHQNKPKFSSWLTAHLNILDDAETLTNNLNSYFDLDSAVGAQLDTLGQIVGMSRTVNYQPLDGSSPVLNDDTYRILVRAKILKNNWDGKTQSIYDLWKNVFPQFGIQVIDNQDMSMKTLLSGQINSSTQQLISNSYMIPKPEGVLLNVVFLSSTDNMPYLGMVASTFDDIAVSMINPEFAGLSTADLGEATCLVPSTKDFFTILMQQP